MISTVCGIACRCGTWCGEAESYATNQTSTYCHIILHQSPGKIRKNIRFGSRTTNRLYNGHNKKPKWSGSKLQYCFLFSLANGKESGPISMIWPSSH